MSGSTIDFVNDLIGQSFKIENPLATASCAAARPFHSRHPPAGRCALTTPGPARTRDPGRAIARFGKTRHPYGILQKAPVPRRS